MDKEQFQKEQVLQDRVDQNYSNYIDATMNLTKENIIGRAGLIADVQDTHEHMMNRHDYEEEELDYLLRFADPLAIVADRWSNRDTHTEDIGGIIADVAESQDVGKFYALCGPPLDAGADKKPKASAKGDDAR